MDSNFVVGVKIIKTVKLKSMSNSIPALMYFVFNCKQQGVSLDTQQLC